MKLYELTGQFAQLEQMADSVESEADALAFSTLWGEISDLFEVKAERTACVIRNLEAEAEAIRAEEKRLAARRRALEGSVDRLKSYLKMNMETSGLDKIKSSLFTISIQNNPPSLKVDESLLPDDFWIVERKPDTAKVKDALKSGATIDGAWLEQGRSLRIR